VETIQGQILMPNTGYGSNKKTKHMLPSGFPKFLVHNAKELEELLWKNLTVLTSHTIFPLRTTEPLWKEQPSWPSVTYSNARLCSEENE
jgi:large subunit ribosomal protein L32e